MDLSTGHGVNGEGEDQDQDGDEDDGTPGGKKKTKKVTSERRKQQNRLCVPVSSFVDPAISKLMLRTFLRTCSAQRNFRERKERQAKQNEIDLTQRNAEAVQLRNLIEACVPHPTHPSLLSQSS